MPEQKKLGRPRKENLYGGHIRAAEDKVADRLPALIDNLLALADGVWTEETTRDGVRRVYREIPDRASNEYLINRIMGKPVESQEISGPDGESIVGGAVFHIYPNGRGPDPNGMAGVSTPAATESIP